LVGKNLEKVNNRLGEWRLVCLDGWVEWKNKIE
jgi:hypothetical protein